MDLFEILDLMDQHCPVSCRTHISVSNWDNRQNLMIYFTWTYDSKKKFKKYMASIFVRDLLQSKCRDTFIITIFEKAQRKIKESLQEKT